jgi:hypothetical protein
MPIRISTLVLLALLSPRPLAAAERSHAPPLLTKAGEPPAEATAPVRAQFPRAKHVSAAGCSVGRTGVPAYGLVFVEDQGANLQADQVRAAAVVRAGDGWKLQLFPDTLDVPGVGVQRGLFTDFVQQGRVAERIEVRCATPASKDRISPRLGKWTAQDKALRATNQLCFAVSNVYNNWACFAYGERKGTFEQTFVQLQAD